MNRTSNIFLLSLLGGILLLAGCTATGGAMPGAMAPRAQVFTWADSTELLSRVPCGEATVDKNTRWLLDQMFDGLVEYAPGTADIIPNLAESWEISDDGLVWTFRLRDDVTFSDGSPLTANDVKFSLDCALAPDSVVQMRIRGITNVEAVDDLTLQITTETPNSALLQGLEEVAGMVQSVNSTPDNPIGTGPYVLTEWNRGLEVELERREDYWGETPTLEKLIYLQRPQEVTRFVQLGKGEIDMAGKLPPEDIATLRDEEGIEVVIPPSSMLVRISLNDRVAPYDNPLVRQAFNYIIDKQAIVDNILLGAGYAPNGVAGTGVFATVDVEGGLYPYDPAQAEQLMLEAGLTKEGDLWQYEGSPLVFRLLVPEGRYLKDRVVGEYVAEQLRAFGVDVQLEVGPWSVTASESRPRLNAGEIDGWLSGFSLPHPIINWADHFSCVNKDRLETGYCNPEFDALIEQAIGTFDEAEQRELYAEAQQIIIEAAPVIWLYGQSPVWGVRQDVQGLEFSANEIPITDKVSIGAPQ